MSGLLEGLAAGAASGAVSSGFGFLANKQQQEYYKENQAKAFEYGQQEQLNRARNARTGLLLAGMSPALAQDGKFAPASAPSAPLGSPAFPNIDVAQAMLASAEAKKADAEAENIAIRNNQEQDANSAARTINEILFTRLAESAKSDAEKAYFTALGDTATTKGSFALLSQLIDDLDKKELYDAHYQEYLVRRLVSSEQVATSGAAHDIIKDMADLPSKQWQQLHSLTTYYLQYAEQLKSQKGLTDEERNLKLAQITLTQQQTEELKEVVKNLKNTNIMKMIDDGEYGKAFLATIYLLLGNISASKRL